ncbi:terminase family protein [Methylobacterium sp. SD274]|uniref:terminase large subunit domain-containing protein n=1 Tax=Methylobacterium sp. SD274 TaxID=2782009 RepID=UPI001FEEC6D3|nr:terminase family protein [Methylobacterium sp. SD274]
MELLSTDAASLGRLDAKRQLAVLLAEKARRRERTKLLRLYPDEGPLRRELYPKHIAFFRAGATEYDRCMLAANRVGKSFGVGGYETALHLTGRYPEWWDGRRFAHPVEWWAAGDTSETTRDIVQAILMGPLESVGTGLIQEADIIGSPSRRSGVTGAFDQVHVRHVTGGASLLGFKSFDQGRKKFQGTAKHGVWLDEEPPSDVFDECMLRLMTTDGLMLCTFTPLSGMTEVTMRYLGTVKTP